MPKSKKTKSKPSHLKPYSKPSLPKPGKPTHTTKPSSRPSPLTPKIPFSPTDRILLVGEGDFSFSHSLLDNHGCTSIVATSYDKAVILHTKYPQAAAHIAAIEAGQDCTVLYGVDATKLGKGGIADGGGGGKEVKRGGFDRVVFNFPHVGGLTKDVNRQVRYNQELLIGFFKAAPSLLSPAGQIIVTTFEGEPYELWNIRDLARHAGLKVSSSFRFKANAYPGYHHARTLGNIEGCGGWKGEDRPARTYIFEIRDGAVQPELGKRKSRDSDWEDD